MATVRTYSLRRDGELNVSKNFKVKEFRCKDGSDTILICKETVQVLQAVRDYFGRPITINSAYRTSYWNAQVGGAKNSQHMKGTAVDFKVSLIPSWAVAGFLEDNYRHCGIGYYSTFIHLDFRGYGVLWKDKGSNTKTTFGLGDNYKMYKAKVEEKPVEDDIMTDKEIYEAVQRYANKLEVPAWAKKELEEAKAAGITDGSNPMALIPRYQAAIMAYRANKR